jgi:hypothetical protein
VYFLGKGNQRGQDLQKCKKVFDWFLGRMKNFSEKENPKMGHYRALIEAELLSLKGLFLASIQVVVC